MADKQEVHPVIELMLKRMDSHPEEFLGSSHRWLRIMDKINTWGNDADRGLLDAKLREIHLEEAHKDALDELLNGEERRREEQERAGKAYAINSQVAALQAQMSAQQIQQQYGTLGMGNANPYANAMTTGLANEIRLGSESINEGLLKQIKGKLGL